MNPNHLIIGLGGTGGKIIRSLRKTVYQEFRRDKPEGVNLRYFYVDSSSEMMDLHDPSWKLFGTSVQLGEDSKLLIRGANLASILENIANYPNLKPWIGDRESWNDILNGIVGDAMGGQKRRLGRFLFANQARKFGELLTGQVRELQTGGQSRVTFHLVCGLAGGTGSGCLIDAIAQIRKLYPHSLDYRILLYTYLPEEHPRPNWNTGNYHANGYAALLDLNALSLGALIPHDVAGDGQRLTALTTPFNGCYLFTNRNENGLTVDTDADLPNIVADFLYQKIVTVRRTDWTSLGRAENAENGDGNPETLGGGSLGVRSKRFLAFGVKRLAIPEEEITEYLSFSFARQAVLQLRYNHWVDSEGFLPEPRKLNLDEYAQRREQLERWGLTDEHLILSLGSLESDRAQARWVPISKYWSTTLIAFKEAVTREETGTRLDRLSAKVEQRFAEQYRGQGVKAFYKTMHQARRERARAARQIFEREMFADWKNGSRSLHEIGEMNGQVLAYLLAWYDGSEDRLEQQKERVEQAQRRLADQQAEWTKMGPLARLTGKPTQLLNAAAVLLQELSVERTVWEGLQFARHFVPEIMEEFSDLKANLDRVSSLLAEATKRFDEGIAARCQDSDTAGDLRRQVIRFYEPDRVKAITRRLIKDEKEQATQTQQVRSVLTEKLGERLDFRTFNERIDKTTFFDTLEKQCLENIKTAHGARLSAPSDRLLGVSILERLRERYPDAPDLRAFVHEIVQAAGNYLTFDEQERNRSGTGINSTAPMAVTSFTVILPRAPEVAEFTHALRAAFKSCSQVPIDFVEKEGSQNEITLVTITNLFPLRLVEQVRFLREKYLERLTAGQARARLELHLEGTGEALPGLFVLSGEELFTASIPYLLLARAKGFFEFSGKPGIEPELRWQVGTGFDREEIGLGKNLVEAGRRITPELLELLKAAVEPQLPPFLRLDATAIQALEATMLAEVESIRAAEFPAPLVKRFQQGGRTALKLLRGEG